MVVNDNFNFIFLHIPKAAGTSISAALQNLEGNNRGLLAKTKHEVLADFYANWRSRAHTSYGGNPEKYFVFGFVRNPWVRMHSFYCYLKEARPRSEIDSVATFRDFLLQSQYSGSWINTLHSMRNQAEFFQTSRGLYHADFVGHYEHLSDDFQSICSQLGTEYRMGHYNQSSSSKKDYRREYDAEMRDIVGKRFLVDVQKFGYVFEQQAPIHRVSAAMEFQTDCSSL